MYTIFYNIYTSLRLRIRIYIYIYIYIYIVYIYIYIYIYSILCIRIYRLIVKCKLLSRNHGDDTATYIDTSLRQYILPLQYTCNRIVICTVYNNRIMRMAYARRSNRHWRGIANHWKCKNYTHVTNSCYITCHEGKR